MFCGVLNPYLKDFITPQSFAPNNVITWQQGDESDLSGDNLTTVMTM